MEPKINTNKHEEKKNKIRVHSCEYRGLRLTLA